MPAKDFFHGAVVEALEREGWKITHDPLQLETLDETFSIDLGAERVIAAVKGAEKIAVEIKSFRGQSFLYEFHAAIGQYESYLIALEEEDPQRLLYLAVPAKVFKKHFSSRFVQKVMERKSLRLIIFNTDNPTVSQWIS